MNRKSGVEKLVDFLVEDLQWILPLVGFGALLGAGLGYLIGLDRPVHLAIGAAVAAFLTIIGIGLVLWKSKDRHPFNPY
jgi:hypothetical protein